jgi:hypothetical protein
MAKKKTAIRVVLDLPNKLARKLKREAKRGEIVVWIGRRDLDPGGEIK